MVAVNIHFTSINVFPAAVKFCSLKFLLVIFNLSSEALALLLAIFGIYPYSIASGPNNGIQDQFIGVFRCSTTTTGLFLIILLGKIIFMFKPTLHRKHKANFILDQLLSFIQDSK